MLGNMRTVHLKAGDVEFTAKFREGPDLRVDDRLIVEAAVLTAQPALGKMAPDNLSAAQQALWREGHPLSFEDNMLLLGLYRATIVATLSWWSLPQPLPTMKTIGELPNDIYQALLEAIQEVSPDVGATDFDVNPDPESPTAGSGASSTPSPAGAELSPTASTTPTTASTATASSST